MPGTSRQLEDARRLYIFVTSRNPDPYVNVIVHAVENFGLEKICFVSVVEHDYLAESDGETQRLRAVTAEIDRRLVELSGGKYTGVPLPDGPVQSSTIDEESRQRYTNCVEKLERIEDTTLVIPWIDLSKKLMEFSSDVGAVFDVTALKKNLLVDVVVLLLSRGCSRVFDFEILRREVFHDQRDLIHSLRPSNNVSRGDYLYRNLAENDHVKQAIKRMVARSMTFRQLVIVTALVAVVVSAVQISFPSSWAQTLVTIVATVAAIAGWLFLLQRD